MRFQSANGYVLFESGPLCTILRAPLFGEVFLQWQTREEWQARPPDAPRWEFEARRDVDALKGYRQSVVTVGRYTLTYWPWEVVRKLRLRVRPLLPQAGPEVPSPPLPQESAVHLDLRPLAAAPPTRSAAVQPPARRHPVS
jgi:hypothetical protein